MAEGDRVEPVDATLAEVREDDAPARVDPTGDASTVDQEMMAARGDQHRIPVPHREHGGLQRPRGASIGAEQHPEERQRREHGEAPVSEREGDQARGEDETGGKAEAGQGQHPAGQTSEAKRTSPRRMRAAAPASQRGPAASPRPRQKAPPAIAASRVSAEQTGRAMTFTTTPASDTR